MALDIAGHDTGEVKATPVRGRNYRRQTKEAKEIPAVLPPKICAA